MARFPCDRTFQETAIAGDIALNFKKCCAVGWLFFDTLVSIQIHLQIFQSLFLQSFHSNLSYSQALLGNILLAIYLWHSEEITADELYVAFPL